MMLRNASTAHRSSTTTFGRIPLIVSTLLMGMTLFVNSLTAPATPSKPSTMVVFGDQYKFLPLLIGKIAAKRGIKTYCICAADTEKNCRRLMYGEEYAKAGIDDDDKAKPISSPDDMQCSLQQADCMLFVGRVSSSSFLFLFLFLFSSFFSSFPPFPFFPPFKIPLHKHGLKIVGTKL